MNTQATETDLIDAAELARRLGLKTRAARAILLRLASRYPGLVVKPSRKCVRISWARFLKATSS